MDFVDESHSVMVRSRDESQLGRAVPCWNCRNATFAPVKGTLASAGEVTLVGKGKSHAQSLSARLL